MNRVMVKSVSVSTTEAKKEVMRSSSGTKTITKESETDMKEASEMTEVNNDASEDFMIEEENTEVSEEMLIDEVALKEGMASDDIYVEPIYEEGMYPEPIYDEGMYNDIGFETGMAEVKDPLLSSWPFVIGFSAVILFVSVALGAFLAKRKIKKGIELYED